MAVNYNYESLLNDNVQFLQGVQADLNKYLPGSGDALSGKAIEGAFYLTTDTHRLYVGRKVDSSSNVYPVQVSAGITTVADSGELAQVATTTAEEGDFYYIESSNVLAVLRIKDDGSKEWVQVNPPSGLTAFTQSTSQDGNNVDINSVITTAASGANREKDAQFTMVAGDNVTLTAGNNATVTIAADDTTYEMATTATTAGAHRAIVGLKANNGNTLDSSVTITGTNGIGVSSDANGAVTVAGYNFTNKGVTADPNEEGFTFGLEYTPGDGTGDKAVEHATRSTIDPLIVYGTDQPIGGVSQSKRTVHFTTDTSVAAAYAGTAFLDIYTRAQTDSAIAAAVNAQLATANAMTYMGAVTSSIADNPGSLSYLITENGAHNGDTYKAGVNFTYNGINIKKGDLVILQGTEVNGVIPSGNLTIDVIPSGDEPYLTPAFAPDSVGSTSTQTILQFNDSKSSNSLMAQVNLNSSEKIRIISELDAVDNKIIDVTAEHRTTARTDTNVANLTTADNGFSGATGSDTIGLNKIQMFILPGTLTNGKLDGIQTDSYGHLTGVTGKAITFQHNRLSSMTVGYTDVTLGNGSTLLSKADASLSVTDLLNQTADNSLTFESSTLYIRSNGAANAADQALAIDLRWGSF